MDCVSVAFGQGVDGGFFNRHGGVSLPPFDSLNVSYGVGDEPWRVTENRARIKAHLGLATLLSAVQIHGEAVFSLSEPADGDRELTGFDALITNQPGVGLLIQQADCQAVVLYDPKHQVVANVHSGWRGSVANIIAKTVAQMGRDFGSNPAGLLAAISPSLGPCCAQFLHFQDEFPASFHRHQTAPALFDFWAISRQQLEQTGIPSAQIHTTALCNRCHPDYFSYRREGQTGRSASVIGLHAH